MEKIKKIIAGVMAVTLTGMIFIPVTDNSIYAEESMTSENEQNPKQEDPTAPEVKVSENFKYSVADGEVIIKGVVDDSKESIEIPDEIDGSKVTSIGISAFENCTEIKKIILPDTLKAIMARAFCNSGLTEINFPSSLNEIDPEAFRGCKDLRIIDLSKATDLKYISSEAFSDCTSLTRVIFPQYVECISAYAFSGCTKLTDVLFPHRVEAILPYAFSGCTGIKQLDLPEEMKGIYENAFEGCTGISKLVIPENIEYVEKNAFKDCTSIKDVVIKSLRIRYDLIEFSDDMTLYAYSNSTAYKSAKENKIKCELLDENKEDFMYTQSEDHITINSYAGKNDSVEIPQTINGLPVTEINESAFRSSHIKQIIIPDSVKVIGTSAFEDCYFLNSVKLPDGLSELEENVFWGCVSLEKIEIPSSVIRINSTAFDLCSGLKELNIPENIEQLGEDSKNMFSRCSSLTSITVDKNNKYFCSVDGILYNKDKTTLISYPCGKTQQSFEVPECVTKIGTLAIVNCLDLENVKICGNCMSFGYNAILDCLHLVSVDIGTSEGRIDSLKFSECPVLADIIVSDDNKSYTSYNGMLLSKDKTKLFFYCPDYDSDECIVPESVKTIGENAIENTQKLQTLIFSEGIESIEDESILENHSIEEIVLPDSIKTVTDRAFGGCKNLKYIEFGKNIREINIRYLFNLYSFLKDVVIKNPECYFTDIVDIPEDLPIKFNQNITFHSYKNSSTEKYCIENNLNFSLISEDDVIYGDINGDGNVDLIDLSTLSLYLLGDKKLQLTQKRAADVKKDGSIDILDLAKLRQYIMHDDVTLGK